MNDTNNFSLEDNREIKEDKGDNVAETEENKIKKKRSRRSYPFAAIGVAECVVLAEGIWKFGSGQKIRRITLFDQLKKSPESGSSRAIITASSKYGFTIGGYSAEYLELSPEGYIAFNPDESDARRLQAKFNLIINNNEYFKAIYDKYNGSKLPIIQAISDFLKDYGLDDDLCEKGAELFVDNAKYLGIIKIMSGAERLVSIEMLLEELKGGFVSSSGVVETIEPQNSNDVSISTSNKICFYISPIGDDESEERKHADLFLESIIAPAFEKFDYKVVRADKIDKAGLITNQIIDYIMNAEFVVCDLSFHNPNVFYELALRHATKRPTIHIIRSRDKIPFDVHDFRTIVIDDSSIYTLIPALESYKNQIVQQINQMLENPDAIDNPILSYLEKNQRDHL